jgi:Ca-activated chloride channel family protein
MIRLRRYATAPLIGIGLAIALLSSPAIVRAGRGQILREPHMARPVAPATMVTVSSVTVNTTIRDGIAETEVSHTFRNRSGAPQEADFLFPIPTGATVSSFALYDGETKFDAQLLDRDEATRAYEEIVRRRRDPGLLTYEGRSALRARVFPIPANGERRVTLKLLCVLPRDGDSKKFAWTLAGPYLPGNALPEHVSVHVSVSASQGLGSLYSPSHDVLIRREDANHAVVTYESGKAESTLATLSENPEFDLYIAPSRSGARLALSVLTFNGAAQQVASTNVVGATPGYFLVIAAPTIPETAGAALPRREVLVLDRSGSMQGRKIEQAKGALRFALGRLRTNDYFNIITFSSEVETMATEPLPATADNLKRAHAFVDDIVADGGTNIHGALQKALSEFPERSAYNTILFFTDGLPTVGVQDHDAIIRDAETTSARKVRVFAFGVGYDVDVPFLDSLSHALRGDADYVRPEEDIEVKTSEFVKRTSEPVLENLRLTVTGARTRDVYPRPGDMPDLFAGSQVLIAGRYTGSARDVRITLTGDAAGKPQTYGLTTAFPVVATEAGFLPRLWASRKIGYLEDELRLHAEQSARQEIVDQIVGLSREFGILTSYSALFVPEPVTIPTLNGPVGIYRSGRILGSASGGGVTGTGSGSALHGGSYSVGFGAAASVMARSALPMGESAVNLSQSSRAQRTAGQVGNSYALKSVAGADRREGEQLARQMRTVALRTFYDRGGVWTDAAYDATRQKAITKIIAFSPAYFGLVKRSANLAQWAALGERVLIVNGDRALEFGPDGRNTLTASEVESLTKGL